MVKKGDEWKDLKAYINFRIKHLSLELQKAPFTIQKDKIDQAQRKLKAKIDELMYMKKIVNGDIKECSKYECRKVQHLNKLKLAVLKG